MADSNTTETIKAIGAIITPIILAFITYLQVRMNKKQEQIHKDVNGKMAQLLEVSGVAKKAEGKAEQRAESETTAQDVVQAIKDDPSIDLTKK